MSPSDPLAVSSPAAQQCLSASASTVTETNEASPSRFPALDDRAGVRSPPTTPHPPNYRPPAAALLSRVGAAIAPRLGAVALVLVLWQAVVWTGWRPAYVLPGPAAVLGRLAEELIGGNLLTALAVTMQRAATGYAIALGIGAMLGLMMARWRPVRTALGPLITGLQSMPSVAWFPLAILLFQLSEAAILFVVALGAAPSIANGLLSGIDHVPPLLVRAGRVLDARGAALYRHVVVPAALPGFIAGLKQGWAFAWRSLMAGELLVIIAGRPSLGVRLQFAREFSDAEGLLALMLVVLAVGMLVDTAVFGTLERRVRERRGLIDTATP